MGLRNRTSAVTVSAISLSIPALALIACAGASQASEASNPVGKLGISEGRWSYVERDYETPYGHDHTNSGTANCNWAPNRGFMICDYLNRNPGNGVPANDLGVLTYNPLTHSYARLGIFNDAEPFAEQLRVEGNTWVASARILRKRETLIYRNVHVFSTDESLAHAITAVSADNGKTWTTISRFTATKVRS
jgi:hypothetical protein